MIKKILILGALLISTVAYACPITKALQQGGQCITVAGTNLYLQVAGHSGPTIVFINGFGMDTTTWNKVEPTIAEFAKVVTYDRPGTGYSNPYPNDKASNLDQAEMLHTLLANANITPPYILVGHSLGGLYAQLFAEHYPKEVIGMVLVDSSTRDELVNITLPAKQNPLYPEALSFYSGTLQQAVSKAGTFPSVPLIILTATHHTKRVDEADWQQWQEGLLSLSPKSMQIIAWNSSHFVQQDQPQLVVDAIATVIKTSLDGKH